MHSSNTQTNLNMNTDPTLRKSIFYFTCKSVFLHLVPSELVWWPSRFRSCTSNSRSNRSHLSSGRWCHSVDISWPPHSVTGSVSTYRVQREVATWRNAQLLRQLTLNKTCSTKKKKKCNARCWMVILSSQNSNIQQSDNTDYRKINTESKPSLWEKNVSNVCANPRLMKEHLNIM